MNAQYIRVCECMCMCVLCAAEKTSGFVGSNSRTSLGFLGFRLAAERGPDSGTGVCTLRRGAVCVTVEVVGRGGVEEG